MPSAQRLIGRVTDENGAGVPDAIIAVERGTTPTPELAIVSGPDGTFTIALPDGSFRIGARTRDGRTGATEVSVPGTTHVTLIVLPAT